VHFSSEKIMKSIILLALMMSFTATAQEVSSVRQTQYDWVCQQTDGNVISGHTRQDKAFQSCFNAALGDSQPHYVVGGTYKVTVTGAPPPIDPPPIDPPPIDPPPIDPPPETQTTFGPVSAPLQYPSTISSIPQDAFRWEITFTVNSLGNDINGLVSRDENGQSQPGHLTVRVVNDRIRVRHQDIAGGHPTVEINSSTVIVPGVEYHATISVEAGVGVGLFVNGILESQTDWAIGLSGNDLPLTLGGYCGTCNEFTPPSKPIDGTIELVIVDTPLELPEPIVGSILLKLMPPTEYEDDTPLEPGYPNKLAIYELNPRRQVVLLDGEDTDYEVTALDGGEHCFVGTAFVELRESIDSNIICKTVE
jgi:hypothetical protein